MKGYDQHYLVIAFGFENMSIMQLTIVNFQLYLSVQID
jgi:hypothetical protein